ncbi:MAG: hypothetical protein JWP48_2433 [Actinoallomurus sp.]|nr:hypothetical protein [Actinoallomurus sp.]
MLGSSFLSVFLVITPVFGMTLSESRVHFMSSG